MAIEETGPNPERLAAAIHVQLSDKGGAVPVSRHRHGLDIVEIQEAPLQGLEGAARCDADRNVGAILINSESPRVSRAVSRSPTNLDISSTPGISRGSVGTVCLARRRISGWAGGDGPPASRHVAQESEANRFASSSLAPPRLMRPYLGGIPDLARVS